MRFPAKSFRLNAHFPTPMSRTLPAAARHQSIADTDDELLVDRTHAPQAAAVSRRSSAAMQVDDHLNDDVRALSLQT